MSYIHEDGSTSSWSDHIADDVNLDYSKSQSHIGSSALSDEQRNLIYKVKEVSGFGIMECYNNLIRYNWNFEKACHGTDRLCPSCGLLLYKSRMQIMDSDEYHCKCGKGYTIYWRDANQELVED